MNRTRWMQFGVLLAVAFVLSLGAGALIGRSRTAGPIAAVPTPSTRPAATPAPSPSPVTPTTPATSLPTLPPTAPPLNPLTAEDFADELLAAFQSGDSAYLSEHLNPLVSDRYGVRQCRRFVNGLADPNATWTVISSSGPAPWDWTTDELTSTVSDTWTVLLEIPDEGEREVHFAPVQATWTWFADCGKPR